MPDKIGRSSKKDSGFCEKSKLTIKDKGVIILITGIPNTEYQISQKLEVRYESCDDSDGYAVGEAGGEF